MVFIEGQIVDIVKKQIFPGRVEISKGRIVKTEKLECAPQRFILPGFIDAHVHIESSMVLPSRFAEAAVSHGTVAVVSDPHEIANVTGMEGVEYMIDDGKKVPLRFYFGAPSCVPATPFDRSGAVLGPAEVDKLLAGQDIFFLSEMMNFPGVVNQQEDVIEKLKLARKYNKPIDGHAPGLRGEALMKYLKEGISTDHETISLDEAREKAERGMIIQIREGSAAHNFEALHPLILEFPEKVMFCTDDCHPNDLVKGHINLLVKKALKRGYPLFVVLRAASLTPRDHYRLDTGVLQPGDNADFIVVDNLDDLNILETWIEGKAVYREGRFLWDRPGVKTVNRFLHRKVLPDEIKVATDKLQEKVRVIEAIDGELFTKSLEIPMMAENGCLVSCPEEDILKMVVVNRYFEGKPSVGFVKGFGLKYGAIAGSVAHDSHNLIAVGVDDDDILRTLNSLMEIKGGIVATYNGIVKTLQLPVAGLMSTETVETVAAIYEELESTARNLGSPLKAPFMTLSFMSLLVIPELKLGDEGLFDVNRFTYTSLLAD